MLWGKVLVLHRCLGMGMGMGMGMEMEMLWGKVLVLHRCQLGLTLTRISVITVHL